MSENDRRTTGLEQRTTGLETRTSALEAAKSLVESLDENTDALNRVRKKYRLTMALLALVALTLFTAAKFNYDGHVRRCETSNELRAEVEVKFHTIADSLERNGVRNQPGGDELIEILYTDIEPNDCSDIDWLGR